MPLKSASRERPHHRPRVPRRNILVKRAQGRPSRRPRQQRDDWIMCFGTPVCVHGIAVHPCGYLLRDSVPLQEMPRRIRAATRKLIFAAMRLSDPCREHRPR